MDRLGVCAVDIKSYKLKTRLEELVESIVSHVKKLLPSSYTLWTMECFFKLSGKNKILFLWCNDLRVFNTVRDEYFRRSLVCEAFYKAPPMHSLHFSHLLHSWPMSPLPAC